MNHTDLTIAVQIIQPACKGEPDLIERIRKAMTEAKDYWASTDDDLRFRGALGAALLETHHPDERRRLEASINAIKNLNALLSGVPVDVERMTSELDEIEVIPLQKMWQEAKAAQDTP